MSIGAKTLLSELAAIRVAQRDDHQAVMARIDVLGRQIAKIDSTGCGQAWQHKVHADLLASHGQAINDLQQSRAEGRGKGTVLNVLVSGGVAVVVGLLVGFFRKLFP